MRIDLTLPSEDDKVTVPSHVLGTELIALIRLGHITDVIDLKGASVWSLLDDFDFNKIMEYVYLNFRLWRCDYEGCYESFAAIVPVTCPFCGSPRMVPAYRNFPEDIAEDKLMFQNLFAKHYS